MGGTSCDVCLVLDGEPLYCIDFEIEFGLPVSVPSVSTRTIGAGGGSIGWVDPGGFLQVGPQSAGADPGPACYGRGGEEATITDANVALGRLDPGYFLGGRLAPRRDPGGDRARPARRRARAAIASRPPPRCCGSRTRTWPTPSASSPSSRASTRARLRARRLRRRRPTHAAEIADAMDMRRVLVPPSPGVCSAFGTLAAAVRVDAVKSVFLTISARTPARSRTLRRARVRARADFAAQGARASEPEIRRSIAMRYQGQNYEQEVTIPTGPITEDVVAAVYADYNRLYEEFYGYRLDGIPIELVRLTVVATRNAEDLPALDEPSSSEAPDAVRNVFFSTGGFQPTPIRHRAGLSAGAMERGPLIVESMDSTVVVPPDWTLSVQPSGILELNREEA